MSRSNPNKKKRRTTNTTLLVFGEGADEDAFLSYLKSLYSFNSGTRITVRKGRGGTAYSIVEDASKIPGDYTKRVAVLDNDKPQYEMDKAREVAEEKGIDLIEHTPCLESVLLQTLNPGESYEGKSSEWHKQEFEGKYLDSKKRKEVKNYSKIFPKNLLDKNRRKAKVLDQLIALMENYL